MAEPHSVLKAQDFALARTQAFLEKSAAARDPKQAADWTLAAKNAAAVATNCETILKIRNGGGR